MLSASARTTRYGSVAAFEFQCSELLKHASSRSLAPRRQRLANTAAVMQSRAQLNKMRDSIYCRNSSLGGKLIAFFRILIRGGYLLSPSNDPCAQSRDKESLLGSSSHEGV